MYVYMYMYVHIRMYVHTKQIKLPRKNPSVFFTQPLEIFLARRENEVINDVGRSIGLFEKLSGFVRSDNQFSKKQQKKLLQHYSRKDGRDSGNEEHLGRRRMVYNNS